MKSNKGYWNDIEKEFQTSGLSRKEFAQAYRINYGAWITFNYCQRKQDKESAAPAGPDMIHFLRLATAPGIGETNHASGSE